MLVVFTGPSLDAEVVRAALPAAVVEPPACRGDVERAVAQGATVVLLIDGGFAHRLAVAPGEIVRALRAGVAVVGAASLGALRAAECHPAGMQGIGTIQRLYRLRVLTDDDEVAVATEPDRGFRASSIALINVRFAVLRALRAGLVDRSGAEAMLTTAKRLHFSERLWEPIIEASGAPDRAGLSAVCQSTDIKRRDAHSAVSSLAAGPLPARPQPPVAALSPPHHPASDGYFGHPREVARDELVRWLTSSGRYRRYWSQAPADAERAWAELETRGELRVELMRWYAVVRGGEVAGPGDAGDFNADPAREAVASAHGFSGWGAMTAQTVDGRLPSGLALTEVHAAANRLARARRGLAGPVSAPRAATPRW